MKKRKILFALAGAGAGNITRACAVIDELDSERFDFAFIAQGRAHQLAPPGFPMVRLRDVSYGTGHFSAWRIVLSNLAFPVRYLWNRRRCAQALDEMRPDLLVVDSDFYCFGEARRRHIPILSVNSSPATVEQVQRMGGPPPGTLFSYHCIEKVDRWLQYRYADRIVCPVLEPLVVRHARVCPVPPVVRRQFLGGARPGAEDRRYDVAVMLGGSGLGASDIDLAGVDGSMVVLGDTTGARLPSTAERVPFTTEPAAWLSRARILVIQAGFNSVSEAVALRKPSVIIPIAHHVEQLVNACTARQLGLGTVARGCDAAAAITSIRQDLETVEGRCEALSVPCDGAAHIARHIEEMAGA